VRSDHVRADQAGNRLFSVATGVVLLLSSLSCSTQGGPKGDEPVASLTVSEILGVGRVDGFERAYRPRPFRFPEDHGPHPSFRTEWWYLTGNLSGPRGEPFGFQLTFFRSALAPDRDGGSGSAWRTNQVYMGHFAVTDGGRGRFHSFERFSRGAVGLAGAEAWPFRVWVEDWELRGPEGENGDGRSVFPLSLRASEGGVTLELRLAQEKPLVLQGKDGLSQKGAEPGNASFYYSFTRLEASGRLTLDGTSTPVRGEAWMDREWSTSALSGEQVGWDWFALQLEDGHDLMVYRLRREDGEPSPFSEGLWVDSLGLTRRISPEEVDLEVLEEWESPRGGATYPARWHLSIPALALELDLEPLIPDQEMDLSIRYWEGAVRVEGTRGRRGVTGKGYVELTGYASREVSLATRGSLASASPPGLPSRQDRPSDPWDSPWLPSVLRRPRVSSDPGAPG
jgi:predicted secreted hydrolase